jgi:PKD repeat protein
VEVIPGQPAPFASLQADKNFVVTNGDVHFSDLSGGSPTAWLWNFGDGQTSTVQNPTHAYATPGVYDVSLTITISSGQLSTKWTACVTVGPPCKVIIDDADWNGHGQYVFQAMQLEYPTLQLSDVYHIAYSFPYILQLAIACGAKVVTYSLTGATDLKEYAKQYAAFGVFSIVASGSNSPVDVGWSYTSQFDKYGIVPCGAGSGTQNLASFACDFFDDDIDSNPATSLESYSTGRIAGKILKVIDALGCPAWEAIYRCAMTASGGGVWTLQNGFGKINVTDAINYGTAIPASPFV